MNLYPVEALPHARDRGFSQEMGGTISSATTVIRFNSVVYFLEYHIKLHAHSLTRYTKLLVSQTMLAAY